MRLIGQSLRLLRVFQGSLILLTCYFLFAHNLSGRDLLSSHEARAAMDAESILVDQSWLLPHLHDGTPELQKPPLYYWLAALVGWLQNNKVDPLAVRLPAVLAGIGCLLFLILLGKASENLQTGLFAALVLGSAIHYTSLTRTGRIDMPLTFTITASIITATLAGYFNGWRRTLLIVTCCLFLAAGALLKGPIGLVLPLVILGLHSVLNRFLESQSTSTDFWYLLWAAPFVALLVVPWYLLIHWRTGGEFTTVFFWYHNVTRGFGGSDLRSHSWWFYGPFFLYGLLPWSLLLPVCIIQIIRQRLDRNPIHRLALIWVGTVVLLLSLARFKRADYLAPAYPAVAWLMAASLRPLLERLSDWAQHALLALGLAFFSLGWLIYTQPSGPSAASQFSHAIRQQAPQPEKIILFRCENHLLSWHLGRPQTSLIDYDELGRLLAEPGYHWIVVPARELEACRRELLHLHPTLQSQVVLDSAGLERPLHLLWTGSPSSSLPCLTNLHSPSSRNNR